MMITLLVYMLSSGMLIQLAAYLYEYPIRPLEKSVEGKYGALVLGGLLHLDERDSDRVNTGPQADRFLHAIQLFTQKKCTFVLFSGGDASIFKSRDPEALLAKRYWHMLNLDTTKFYVECSSRNTRENALLSAQIIREKQLNDTVLVCTSAWHMPRALMYVKKSGLTPIPYCTDALYKPQKPPYLDLFVPQVENIAKWNKLIKEWIGYLVAWVYLNWFSLFTSS